MNWYLKALQNYANFSGRARRKEYWMFVLFNIIFSILALVADNLIGLAGEVGFGLIYTAYYFATLIPGIAVLVRRLHDIGKSGWFFFVSIIPLIGGIWLLVLTVTSGDIGDNEYGPDPKESLSITSY